MHIFNEAPKRLCHLPLVTDVFRRTGMADVIDHAVGQDPRSLVSTSECVAVILSGVFVGAHSLWRLRERLEPFDMRTIMQDATFNLAHFPEERLAKALDDIYLANPDKLMTAISVQAIEAFSIDTTYLHFDTTSLSFYGAYESEDPFTGLEGVEPPPRITYGHSKIKRPDLKQIMYGMMVSNDGGVPLLGKALDGNASDSIAAAEFFGKIRGLVEDPHKVCCIADSKGWCGRTLATIQDEEMRLLSRLPRSRSTHKMLENTLHGPLQVTPCLLPGATKKSTIAMQDVYEYIGCDIDETFSYRVTDDAGGTHTRRLCVPARAVRIFSRALLRTKTKTLGRTANKETRTAQKKIALWQYAAYACADDAHAAAQRYIAQTTWTTKDVSYTVTQHEGPFQKPRGRPPKAPTPVVTGEKHWRVTYTTATVSYEIQQQRLRSQATFVLIRNRVDGWDISDEDMIRRYKDQYRVEHGFAWLKSGADINPAFIHTPHRIAALCFTYCLGLMIWNLIQRTVRKNLKQWGTGLPYHRNKPSDNITTRFLFELFPTLGTLNLPNQKGDMEKKLLGYTDIHELACRALEASPNIFTPIPDKKP